MKKWERSKDSLKIIQPKQIAMITEQKANRLIHATSPYLLQHAYNPVDWYEWGSEALERARAEDKPILVSIGYSSCHWCHVMERESFEKEDVAAIMNNHFICIKVDREERPDIDQVYMDAVHALGVQGGWPLNVFITPDQKPFFGGTYFSRDMWKQMLINIDKAYRMQRERIESTAEELRAHLQRSEVASFTSAARDSALKDDLATVFTKLDEKFDKEWGGMDKAPKFVMPTVWLWLLRYYHLTQDDNALLQLNLTLRRVAHGGIYDQIGGGFARYSVDSFWFAPHFEKMLYDNAQLMSLYSEAFAITKDEEYKNVVYETFGWLQRDMTSDAGGFFSALDADSEGVEGKFYIWTKEEFDKVMGDESPLFAEYYNVAEKGNWEHNANILHRSHSDEVFLTEKNIEKTKWEEQLRRARKSLLRERNTRVAPGLDDKIITSWNAMMISGLTDAYKAFDDKRFLKAAILNMRFLENDLMESTTVYRSYKGKRSNVNGFLDDYACLIQSQLKLYEVTFDEYWIRRAKVFTEHVLDQFFDSSDGYFFYTSNDGEKLLSRKKEIFDNVIPSSNSIMAWNLFRLGTILDRNDWKDLASKMALSLSELIINEPYYMSNWGIVFLEIRKGLAEIAFVGEEIETLRQEFHIEYQPFSQVMGTKAGSELPLLADKGVVKKKPTVYVCYNKTCFNPVHSVEAVTKKLSKLNTL
jgi:uncharacterized protein